MPSKSTKQHRLMQAAMHDKEFAKKAGVPQSVAREFVAADAEPSKSVKQMRGTMKRKK